MITTINSIVAFLIIIAICVIVHELGHYWTAKILGVQSHEFSLGMGTLLYQYKSKSDMKWSLRLFPIGGFVRIAGMLEEEEGEAVRHGMGFNEQPCWKRFFILANGSIMNIILAICLMTGFLFFNGIPNLESTVIGGIQKGMPGEINGLMVGDKIIKVNDKTVDSWLDMTTTMRKDALEGAVEFTILRNDELIKKMFVVPMSPGTKLPTLGILTEIKFHSFTEALGSAFSEVSKLSILMLSTMWNAIIGKEAMDFVGPVGIASMSGKAMEQGFWNFITFLAIISLNLGILNLVPFPALDGGRILVLGGEAVIRRKLPPKFEASFHMVGIIVLLIAIAFVTWKDIVMLL